MLNEKTAFKVAPHTGKDAVDEASQLALLSVRPLVVRYRPMRES